ncbi:MAG: recombinase family protein, partial [Planctomycetes bacterium]|nr:recombinase family protein [Planctomycetota bacterium]
MAIVYSYLRFSRPEQMKGDSHRRQVNLAPVWAKQNGHELDASLDLSDKGVSAFRGKNAAVGALAEFLDAAQEGRVKPGSILAIESFDRLSRQEIDDADQLFRRVLKAGIEIKTFEPDDYFTEADLNNPMKRVMALMIMSRAHEESATKACRLKRAWSEKRERVGERKLTGICPKWLRPVRNDAEQVVSFEPIPERVETVRRLFSMAADGMGYIAIVKALNAEGVPTLGKGELWARSSVRKILTGRAVLGEHQPHEMRDGRRIPVGEPIPDYFPRVIEDRDFYAVQQSLEARRTQPGRHSDRVANLFTGLVRDARDGSTCQLVDKGFGLQLVSSAAKSGHPGAVYLAFPYAPFEQALLAWGYDLNLGDVLPRKATNLEAALGKVEGKVADLGNRIETLRRKMKTADNFDALVDLLVELENDKADAEAKVEALKREMATTESEALDRTKELIERLQAADAEEVYRLRLKLRSMLKRLVASIVLLPRS